MTARVRATSNTWRRRGPQRRQVKRGPGRPPKAASSSGGLDGIAGILDMVKNADREHAQLRSALDKIQAVLESALA